VVNAFILVGALFVESTLTGIRKPFVHTVPYFWPTCFWVDYPVDSEFIELGIYGEFPILSSVKVRVVLITLVKGGGDFDSEFGSAGKYYIRLSLPRISESDKCDGFTAKADYFLSSELFVIELFLVGHLPRSYLFFDGSPGMRDGLAVIACTQDHGMPIGGFKLNDRLR
jgi:hypothetical protein